MVNTNKIRGLMAEKNITGEMLADDMKITPNTFYRKMKKRKFNSDEMKVMAERLEIKDPYPVFFAD